MRTHLLLITRCAPFAHRCLSHKLPLDTTCPLPPGSHRDRYAIAFRVCAGHLQAVRPVTRGNAARCCVSSPARPHAIRARVHQLYVVKRLALLVFLHSVAPSRLSPVTPVTLVTPVTPVIAVTPPAAWRRRVSRSLVGSRGGSVRSQGGRHLRETAKGPDETAVGRSARGRLRGVGPHLPL